MNPKEYLNYLDGNGVDFPEAKEKYIKVENTDWKEPRNASQASNANAKR